MARLRDEAREVLWLASVVGGLSVLGVALAVGLAVLGEWHSGAAVAGQI